MPRSRLLISIGFLVLGACSGDHRGALPPAPAPLPPPKAAGHALEPIALPVPQPPANPALVRPSSAPMRDALRAMAAEVTP